jgi:hypothetical protein
VGCRAKKAFEGLRSYLKKLPMLSSLEKGQPLILYVLVMHIAVSGALMVKKGIVSNGKAMKKQFIVYFVSKVLTGSKRLYSEMEKSYYTVVMSACKL